MEAAEDLAKRSILASMRRLVSKRALSTSWGVMAEAMREGFMKSAVP